MAVIDRVKWDGAPSVVAWKFPSEELSTWTQLIVNESQEAYLVKGGVYEGPFGAGRHTLSTENIPIIRAAMGLPFGGKTPFSAEVWFVNRVTKLDVKWGTATPIQLQDPQYSIMIPVRAYGQYGMQIVESKKFLQMLVGTLKTFDVENLSNYFRGKLIERISSEIAKVITRNKIPILQISSFLDSIAEQLKESLEHDFRNFGVSLQQLSVASINIPEDDVAVRSLKAALAKRAEMGIVGFSYQQERSFDVMHAAASNEGSTQAGMMGAGLGLGLGVGAGVPMGSAMTGIANNLNTTTPPPAKDLEAATGFEKKLEMLSKLSELKDKGVLTQDEFDREKNKILSN
jgi:membrane protease subunit (stomatin/prohibitin family)